MDVLYFLRRRTEFIRNFYDSASHPFCETMRKIEAGEGPYEPPYSEDGEPAFLSEWGEADTSLEVLGRSCVSMLSSSLQLYFKTWERLLGVQWAPNERDAAFKKGFINGYRVCFGDLLNLSWDDCPADFAILEQLVLARNRDQHPEKIHTMDVTHDNAATKKFPDLFFARDSEKAMYSDLAGIPWLSPKIQISRDTLMTAISNVEKLAGWLEEKLLDVRFPHRRK